LAPLDGLTALKYLDLDGNPGQRRDAAGRPDACNPSISPATRSATWRAGGLTALERLDLDGTQVSDVAPWPA